MLDLCRLGSKLGLCCHCQVWGGVLFWVAFLGRERWLFCFVTWCSLACNIPLSLGTSKLLLLLAPSYPKCQISSAGRSMKASHSRQCEMLWPGQAGLNISAACQQRLIAWRKRFQRHISSCNIDISNKQHLKGMHATSEGTYPCPSCPSTPCPKGQQPPAGVF